MEEKKLVDGVIAEKAKIQGAVGDYIYKPVNIFLVGANDDIPREEIYKKFPWMKEGIGKMIKTIKYTEDLEDMEKKLKKSMIKVPSMGFVPKLVLPWRDDLPKPYLDKVIKIIDDYESVQTVNIATRLVHSEIIQENEYMNLAHLNHSIWGYNLHKIFEGRTVLCIAGGPSLQEQLPLIKEHQDKFVIICVSTVAELLFNNGITPHIIGTIDMKEENRIYIDSLKPEWQKKSYFAFEVDAHRNVVDAYKGPKIMIAADIDRAPITMPLKTMLPNEFTIPKSGTVSNIIYTIAKLTNPKEIILVGYDLCYTGERSHVDGTRFNRNVKIINGTNGFFLQFNDNPNVQEGFQVATNHMGDDGKPFQAVTIKSFYTYLVELNLRIDTEPKIKTYDVGLDSAKKEHCEYKPLQDVIKMVKPPKTNAFDELAKLSNKVATNGMIKKYLKNIGVKLNKAEVKFNHVSKITYLMRQYQQYPILKYGKILHRLEEVVNRVTKNEIQELALKSYAKWKKLNEEEQNGND